MLVSAIGVFYLYTIREGHVWGDDHAAYIHHARNIVEGRPYGDIGYIRNSTSINPEMYPPGFPLLLAPLYHFYGFNLKPMKVLCILSFCLALGFFYLATQQVGEIPALLTIGIIGVCPYFWDFKDSVFSEYPFLAFTFASLSVANRVRKRPSSEGMPTRAEWRRVHTCQKIAALPPHRTEVLHGLGAGVLCGFAHVTRGVGVVLPAVLLLTDYLRRRKLTLFSLGTVAGFAAIVAAERMVFTVNSDYLTSFQQSLSMHSLLASPLYYLKCLAVPWDNGYSAQVQMGLYMLLGVLALHGLRLRVWGGASRDEAGNTAFIIGKWTVLELFTVIYLLFIILFPWGGRRYLIPIMPFFVLYALVGVRSLTARFAARSRVAMHGVLTIAVASSFALKYTTVSWREIIGGMQSQEASALMEFIRRELKPEGAVVFRKARLLALYSRLRCADIYESGNAEASMACYRKLGVSHVITSDVFRDPAERILTDLVQRFPAQFERLLESGPFAVYRFNRLQPTPSHPGSARQGT